MASVVSEDESSDEFSENSQFSIAWMETNSNINEQITFKEPPVVEKTTNIVHNLANRQIYGRFTKHPRAKTERAFNKTHTKCRFALSSLITLEESSSFKHIYMGFTMCGRYFLSFSRKFLNLSNVLITGVNLAYEYTLFVWRFIPGQKFKLLCQHNIFKNMRGTDLLDKIYFMQYPSDYNKIICYGLAETDPEIVYITILTIPNSNCKHCKTGLNEQDSLNQGWCLKHGFIIHYMFSMTQPSPTFEPRLSLAYPNHLVINTGLYIHILNVSTKEPSQNSVVKDDVIKLISHSSTASNFNDALSEVSESTSEYFGTSSVVDAILEDFSEYDLESSECNKPFHELNISCEPLNVTGKSYHNTLVQNIVDPRLKRLQHSSKDYLFSVPQSSGNQKSLEKSKIDKKNAEKAYEFIEENEKCEKLSSFRKKRLAEKKYEFSEDNSENIVPFNSLRRERRYLYRSQNRCIRSPDYNSIFLGPRSPSIRSPMQSPNSRNGQFSPGGARNIYCTSIRNSPHHSKSPISPRDSARKFYVYSPSMDSDCSDSDSRLILRTANNTTTSHLADKSSNGLLIVDPKSETPKWIRKVVRRYSNGDFENSSLLSGQSRDDNNLSIEIPLMVQNLTDQHLDVVPECKADQLTETQLIVTQRSFDCEQFVYRRAQKLCHEHGMEFLHCEDYDVKIMDICPIRGHIVCQAVIKVGALKGTRSGKPQTYASHFLFTWNIETDAFDLINGKDNSKLLPSKDFRLPISLDTPQLNCKSVHVLDYCSVSATKTILRDYDNYFEICLSSPQTPMREDIFVIEEYSSDESDSF